MKLKFIGLKREPSGHGMALCAYYVIGKVKMTVKRRIRRIK